MDSHLIFFLYIKQKGKFPAYFFLVGLILLYIGSFCFGLFGNKRSNLDRSFVINDLRASSSFEILEISHNHYMTYLYICSPLANLQKNIDGSKGFLNNNDIKDFVFYSLIPPSLTRRVEGLFYLSPPNCGLISPYLIVGSYYMIGFKTLGWLGMIILAIGLIFYIVAVVLLIPRKSPFYMITIVLLSTTISMLIFDNMLIRLDVILMVFGYPYIFYKLQKIISIK